MPFCPSCGAEVQPSHNFCSECGGPVSRVSPDAATPPMPGALGESLGYSISPRRIFLMTFLSYGLYLFYWFYLTWKQYRDHTGNEAYPIWHALSLAIPIYGLFRTHAHMRSFKEVMFDAGVENTISVGWAVVLVLVASALDGLSFHLTGGFGGAGPMTRGSAVVGALIDVTSMAIVWGLLLHVQGNLNLYWASLNDETTVDSRTGAGEVILVLIGAFAWLDTLASLFSASYRGGL